MKTVAVAKTPLISLLQFHRFAAPLQSPAAALVAMSQHMQIFLKIPAQVGTIETILACGTESSDLVRNVGPVSTCYPFPYMIYQL